MVVVKWIFSLALAASAALWLAGCQSTGSIGQLGGTLTSGGVTLASVHMPVGQQVVPPYGFIAFCLRNPKECEGGTDKPTDIAMTAERWSQLNEVNDYVNRSIPQIEDIDNYGVAEKWAYPNERGGDCEDLALLKRKMLIERGWPASNLLMTVVREWNGDGHAILVVASDKGDYVLDNKNWAIVSWADAPYTWIKQQSRVRPYIWVNLDQSSFRVASNQTVPPLGAPVPFIEAASRTKTATVAAPLRPSLAAEQPQQQLPLSRPQQMPTATLASN